MTPTLSDIAKATNTSVSTVSRVLGGGDNAQRISPATRERVSAVARRMGYRPNLLARSLRTRRSNTVALLVSDISNAFFAQLAWVMEEALHQKGYSLVLCNSGENAEREMEYLNLLPCKGIDGLIVVPVTSDADVLRAALPAGLPLVLLDRPMQAFAPSVTTDQIQAADMLCDALDRVGVKKIAMIRGPSEVSTHSARAGRLAERFEVIFEEEGPAHTATVVRVSQELMRDNPDAIACTNNVLTLAAIEVLRGVGSRMPIIASFDELPAAQIMPMPVVSAEQDIVGLATACVEQLLPLLEGAASKPSLTTLPAKLTTNALSTPYSPAADPPSRIRGSRITRLRV